MACPPARPGCRCSNRRHRTRSIPWPAAVRLRQRSGQRKAEWLAADFGAASSRREHFRFVAGRGTSDYTSAMLDWSSCAAVERTPEKVSGAWVFRGTRVPVKALFENLEGGATIDQFL